MKSKLIFLLAVGLIFSSVAQAEIKIVDPLIRAIGPNAALFMTIENTSNKPDKLIKAAADPLIVQSCAIHTHTTGENHVCHMEAVNFIEVPEKGQVKLESGGYHVMLTGLRQPLQKGRDVVRVTLTFENEGDVTFISPVDGIGEK